MKNLLLFFFLAVCTKPFFSQRPMVVTTGNDSVCLINETPTGKSSVLDRSTLWLKADKSGSIVYTCPSQLQKIGARSGVYTFDPDGDGLNLFQGYYDSSEGGGWLMVLNYVHQGGTNPNLTFRSTDLPLLGSSTLGTDESGTAFWGHAIPSLLNQFNIEELRFYAITNAHARVIHFSTANTNAINYVQSGTGSMTGINSGFTTLSGHSAFMPNSVVNYYFNRGNEALTRFPFWRSGTYHWGIRGNGNRWEVDDYPNNFSRNTIHRVFIRVVDSLCDCPTQSANPSDGSLGDFWGDVSNNGNNAEQTTNSSKPIYRDNLTDGINFNPSFFFDGSNDFLRIPWDASLNTDSLTVFSVHQVDGSPFTWRTPFGSRNFLQGGYNIYASNSNNYQFWTTSAGTGWNISTNGAITDRAELLGIDVITGAGTAPKQLFRNGSIVSSTTGNYMPNTSTNYTIGMNDNGGAWPFHGRIAEQILYPKILSAHERNVIETYLGIKYGITLSHNYISPDSVVLFDVSAGYNLGITGVGKNKHQGLYQQKSHSESDASNGVTLELTTQISSGTYLICGHDAGGLTRTTLYGEANVLTRKYYAEQTGGTGTINLELNLAEIGANTSLLPNQVKILISNEASFSNIYILEATSVSGGIAYFTGVPLMDKYFTFKAAP